MNHTRQLLAIAIFVLLARLLCAGQTIPGFFIVAPPSETGSARICALRPSLEAVFEERQILVYYPVPQGSGSELDYSVRPRRIELVGVNPGLRLLGEDLLEGRANFFHGEHAEDWRTDVPLYGAVRYRGVWPSIDMIVRHETGALKTWLVLEPGSNPATVRLRMEDASIATDESGGLMLNAEQMELREPAPEAWQEVNGEWQRVEARFELTGVSEWGVHLGKYRKGLPVIMGPLLTFSSVFGGSGMDAATAVAAGAGGEMYAAGYSESANLPVTSAWQGTNRGGVEAWAAKLNAAGTALAYVTYLGGAADDRAFGIAAVSDGSAVITGWTTSTNFPVQAAARPTHGGGGKDGFVARLGAAGNTLQFSTYIGGSGADARSGVAVDASGNAYATGSSTSTNLGAVNAYQAANRGGNEAFLVKFSSAGAIQYLTYLGGARDDRATAVAVDASGAAYVTGGTESGDFPVVSSVRGTLSGAQDAFVSKLGAGGGQLLYSTYLGGSAGSPTTPETGYGIAVDGAGAAYVAGTTSSADFPVVNAYQSYFGKGVQDAFVAKLAPAGNALAYSTFLGGTSQDAATSIAVDSAGVAHVGGFTYSKDFPLFEPVQSAAGAFQDGFVTKLGAAGNSLAFSTYLGGNGADSVNGIAVRSNGAIYVAGQTMSSDFPLVNPLQNVLLLMNAFLGRIGGGNSAPTADSVSPSSGAGTGATFTLRYSDADGSSNLNTVGLLIHTQISAASACYLAYLPASNTLYLADNAGTGFPSKTLGAAGTLENSQCSVNVAASTAVLNANTLTLTLAVSFKSGFNGTKNIYMLAVDNASAQTGWRLMGTYTISQQNSTPTVDSVSPPASSGMGATFTLRYSDADGAANLNTVGVLIHTQISAASACYLAYLPASNTLYLADNAGTGFPSKTLGAAGTLENSQCSIDAAASTAVLNANTLTLTLAVSFKSGFLGAKNIYMLAVDNASAQTGWRLMGFYTISQQNSVPTVDSVSPPAGSGMGTTFTSRYSDADGASNLNMAGVLIHTQVSAAGACYLAYLPASNTLYLADDAGTGFPSMVLGAAGTIQNSQCSVNVGASTAVLNANTLTLTLAISFKTGFLGAKNIYMLAMDNASAQTGWRLMGTYAVQ